MRSLIVLLSIGFLTGCCAHRAASPHTAASPMAQHGARGATAPVPLPFSVVNGVSGATLNDAALTADLRSVRAIYVGEQHPNPHDHAVELEVLERAYAADPSVGLGMEMLPFTMQSSLDAYVAGTLDDAAFLKAVNWKKTWGYPFGFYRPLLQFCRAHHLRAYALNAPHDITHKVAFVGMQALTPAERAELPEMKPGPEAHQLFVAEAFGAHPHDRFASSEFDRFYTAQLIWDETMATHVAAALTAPNGPHLLVVVAGEGHVRRFGIPDRAARRGIRPYITILALFEDDLADARAENAADLYFVLRAK